MLMRVSKVYMTSFFCLLGFTAASGVVRLSLISPELLRLFVFTAFAMPGCFRSGFAMLKVTQQMKAILMAFLSRTVLATVLLSASALSHAANAQEPANQPIASGYHSSCQATAEVSGVVADGDKLTVKVHFINAKEGGSVSTTLYTALSDKDYENDYYLLAGDKKYLLLKDSEGKPLAPASVSLFGNGHVVGVWHGVFPAPPKGQKVTLYIKGVEPLGPFAVPAE